MSTVLRLAACACVAAVSAVPSAFAWGGIERVADPLVGNKESADVAVQTLVANAMGFLGILAVLYGIWGGFTIMTAGGDDEKVKKGKTVLVQAAIGVVVIYLAYSIVAFVLNNILGGR